MSNDLRRAALILTLWALPAASFGANAPVPAAAAAAGVQSSPAPSQAQDEDKKLADAGRPFKLEFTQREDGIAVYHDKAANAWVFVPPGYHLAPPVKNSQVAYNFALKNDTAVYEVRIRFSPPMFSKQRLAECRDRNRKSPGTCTMADPDAKTPMVALMMRMNLSGGEQGRMTFFPDQAVGQEFGGDWGLTSDVFSLKDPDFAGPYTVGQINQVHKNGVGTYSLIHVGDTLQTHADLNLGSFHVVLFDSEKPARPPKP